MYFYLDTVCLNTVIYLFRYRLSEAHSHADALSRMTDHIFYDILYSTKADFEEARKLLLRILRRDLYKIVACRNLSTELLNTKVYPPYCNTELESLVVVL
jgi:hypothetical protein